MDTIVICDRNDPTQVSYALQVTDKEKVFVFDGLHGLLRLGKADSDQLYGTNWYHQVAGALDHAYLGSGWSNPVEIIMFATHPMLDSFYHHFRRVGFITRPTLGMDPKEATKWLRQRV